MFENRKINIGVIIFMEIMPDTTISVSKRFHDWLKGNGKKGESYEDIIKKMLKPEFLQELEEHTASDDASNDSANNNANNDEKNDPF